MSLLVPVKTLVVYFFLLFISVSAVLEFFGTAMVVSRSLNLCRLLFVLPSTRFSCLCDQVGGKAPPAAGAHQMYHSTASSLDTRASLSSDEDGDIYRHPERDGTICAADETSDRQLAPDVLNRGSHKPDQVGTQHQF